MNTATPVIDPPRWQDVRVVARLIIVIGLPGAAKTTVARRLAAQARAYRFNADEWMAALGAGPWDAAVRDRVEALQWKVAQDLLTVGTSALIEWGTWTRAERDRLREGARRLGARVELCVVDAPDAELWRRVTTRGMEDPPITREQITQWRSLFQAPSPAERAMYDHIYRGEDIDLAR